MNNKLHDTCMHLQSSMCLNESSLLRLVFSLCRGLRHHCLHLVLGQQPLCDVHGRHRVLGAAEVALHLSETTTLTEDKVTVLFPLTSTSFPSSMMNRISARGSRPRVFQIRSTPQVHLKRGVLYQRTLSVSCPTRQSSTMRSSALPLLPPSPSSPDRPSEEVR